MSLIPDTEAFEAVRKAHFAVILHKQDDFEGMRRAGHLAAEVLDLMVPLVKPGVCAIRFNVSTANPIAHRQKRRMPASRGGIKSVYSSALRRCACATPISSLKAAA